MIRHILSLVMVAMAISLLGALVLLSTSIDQDSQRGLDQTLSHMTASTMIRISYVS